MARPEVTGRKPTSANVMDDADAYSIDEFCGATASPCSHFTNSARRCPGRSPSVPGG